MILLWGISSDGPLASVRAALERAGTPVAFLDQQAVLQSKIDLRVDGRVGGRLKTQAGMLDLSRIQAVYFRPYDTRKLPSLAGSKPDSRPVQKAFSFENALTSWLELTPALVLNRPSAMASNNSKPYQLGLIRAAGLEVPETLVTTDPSAAVAFQQRHGSVIYKSVSGVRSIVTRLGPEHRERLEDIANCPTQFQQYIDGTDVRVHVVGEEIFGCEIRSSADDYRYPDRQAANVEVQSCEVPAEVSDQCVCLARSLNLPLAGIDFRRTRSGQWVCFEANPSPGFTFYEQAAGQPISEAVARLLVRGLGCGVG
jgi:glutathione synthase/RimK-type ligase-like ATP-grasp enzyme